MPLLKTTNTFTPQQKGNNRKGLPNTYGQPLIVDCQMLFFV